MFVSLLNTADESSDKQMSLATSVRDSFDVREPLVDLETRKFSDFKDCTHKADIVIVYHSNSFSSFLL